MAIFLARATMFSIIAPELKSLKYRTSLSPLAYVTSRNRFSSLSAYIRSTVRWIIAATRGLAVAAVLGQVVRVERRFRREVLGEDVARRPLHRDVRS